MQHKELIKKLMLLGALAMVSSNGFAAGFQSFETNGSGMGNAYAGGAAIGDDASKEFDNPASIVRLNHPELDISNVFVFAHSTFIAGQMDHPIPGAKNPVDILGTFELPSIHFTSPLTERLYFGFGVTVPFGYSTNYGYDAVSSLYAQKSEISAININPSFAYKVTNKFSVGLGFNVQYLNATYNRAFMMPLVEQMLLQGHMMNKADDWGYGWNAGLLYQFDEKSRIGLSYRSHVYHSPTGDAKINGAIIGGPTPIPVAYYWNLDSDVDLPETVLLSGYHDFNDKIAAMASISYTHWSRFDDLCLKFANGAFPMPNITAHEGFHNSFRFSLGGNYRFNEHFLWRVGAAFDQSPVDDGNRTAPLPDSNRIWLSTGLQYVFNHYVTADAGYSHIFLANGSLHNVDPVYGLITGRYNNNFANLLGVQLSIKFT
jgi:long-chain fatty acid transport protein